MRPSPALNWCRRILVFSLLFAGASTTSRAQSNQSSPEQLKQLSLEQLGNVEVTSKSKAPEQVWKTAAAIYVITQDDIRRSGRDDNSGSVAPGAGRGSRANRRQQMVDRHSRIWEPTCRVRCWC